MIQKIPLFITALFLLAGRAASTSLEFTLDNSFYTRDDRLDSTANYFTYSEGLSAGLEKIGATNLSLYSDIGLSNSFLGPTHKQFELRSLYLDAPVIPDFNARIGRQLMYDLISKNVCLDGAKLDYDIAKLVRLHAYLGEPIPSRYSDGFVREEKKFLQGGFGADFAVHPTTWIGVQAADITDTSGNGTTGTIPIAGYIDSRINKNINLKADAEYDMAGEKMEEYSVDISGRPASGLQWRAYLLGESQAIDSTNAYERLVLGKYTDIGFQIGCNDRRNYTRGYYSIRMLENGNDQLAGVAASAWGVFLDIESGTGVSGSSIKTAAGYAIDILESLRCGAGASYYVFKLSQNPVQEYSLTTRAYLNWTIPAFGISIAPEVQYLSNEYYRNDVRFQLNVIYQFLSFWKS